MQKDFVQEQWPVSVSIYTHSLLGSNLQFLYENLIKISQFGIIYMWNGTKKKHSIGSTEGF